MLLRRGGLIPEYPDIDGDQTAPRSFGDSASRFLENTWDQFWGKVVPAIPGEGQLASALGGLFYKVPYYAKALKASDLGLKGSTTLLRGGYVFNRGVITIRVDMIRGNYSNAWQAIPVMLENARKAGGKTLIIEGRLGNPALQRVLQRLGAEITTEGGMDKIVFGL